MSRKTRIILAMAAALVASILGGITLLKVTLDLHPDWAIIRDILSAKLRVIAVGDCNLVYDRDTGELKEKICRSPTGSQITKHTDGTKVMKDCPTAWGRNWTTGDCTLNRPERYGTPKKSFDRKLTSCEIDDLLCLEVGKSITCDPPSNRISLSGLMGQKDGSVIRKVEFYCD